MVDKLGKVDMNAPIIWDFDQITDITALPIDEKTLTIKGGRFTTIANNAESKYTYYSRGITIRLCSGATATANLMKKRCLAVSGVAM